MKSMKKIAGATKYNRGGLKKANNGTVVRSNAPSYARSQAKAEELYDSDPSVRSYTNGPMTKEEYQNAAETAASKRAKALGAGPTMKRGGMTKTKYMTGGMVNSNAKVSALKQAGSNGVKSGTNPKAKASGKATGKSGGTSKAPKTAVPKAKYGMAMKGKSC